MKKLINKILHHPMLHKQTVVQATILISIINFLGKFVGYAREMLIAKYFGATGVMDAYVIGLQVPTLVLGLFAGGLGTLIIPMYISRKQKDPQDAKRYVNQILLVWGAVFLVVSALTAVFAPQLVRLVAYGFQSERFDLAVQITRLLALFGFFNILNSFFKGLLEAEKQFLTPTISVSFFNIINVIALSFLSRYFGVYALVIGSYSMVIGNCLFFMYLLLRRYRLLNLRKLNINWKEIKEFMCLLTPLILTSGLISINTLIDRSIASSLPEGSIAALRYAERLWNLPIALFASTLAITVFPLFSELASDRLKLLEYKKSINKAIITLMYFLIPSSVFLILYSQPLTKFLYQRGAFDAQATSLTSYVNEMYCLGIYFTAMYPILMKSFFSFKNTTTPLITSLVVVVLNIAGNIILSRYLFVGGIALATSISNMVGYMMAYFLLLKYFRSLNDQQKHTGDNLFVEFSKILVSVIPMLAIGLLLISWTRISTSFIFQAIKLVIIALIMGLAYYFTTAYFKTKGHKIAQYYFRKSSNVFHFMLGKGENGLRTKE